MDTKVQKIVNQLISEEYIAYHLYKGCNNKKNSEFYSELFDFIAEDELDDHVGKLAKWALDNGYTVPMKFDEFEKYADKELVKLFHSIKKDGDKKYFVTKAIESEQLAMKSYFEIMTKDETPQDLAALCNSIYYEEMDHYSKLMVLSYAIDSSIQTVKFNTVS